MGADSNQKETRKYILAPAKPIAHLPVKKAEATETKPETYRLRSDVDFLLMLADEEVDI